MKDYSNFEQKNNIFFNDKSLLKQAFIHRSYVNEAKGKNVEHNERLEFLGDAVMELIVTDFLYKKFPEATEGDLTSYRSALVNANTCSQAALEAGINDYLALSRGEAKDKGKARQNILADAFEAVVGAIYLDQGVESAAKFISNYLLSKTDSMVENKSWIDSKSLFQERSQDIIGITPSYKTTLETGPDHDKHFTVAVFLGNEKVSEGNGKSKQEAEQAAAKLALEEKGWN